MKKIRLKKSLERGEWPSAIWLVDGYPNLVIYANGNTWYISMMGPSEENNPQALRILDRVEHQEFRTRKEAVQAVQAALLFEED